MFSKGMSTIHFYYYEYILLISTVFCYRTFDSSFCLLSLSYNILISLNKRDIFVPILAETGIIGKSIFSLSNLKFSCNDIINDITILFKNY